MVGPDDNMPSETAEKDARRSDTAAEAAVWVARLKSDQRLPETESAFRHWLATTPNAQSLFDEATEVWEMIPCALQVRSAPAFYQSMSRRVAVVGAIAAVFVLVIFGGFFAVNARPIVYETQTGEQRTLTMADGSKVTLNTDTRLSVTHSRNRRYIQFDHGEAIFQVAHDTSRPFVVETGTQRVTALGTVFLVRSDPSAMQVALFSGKVELRSKDSSATPSGMILKPGERATVREGLSPIVDRPSSDVITAWQRQEIVFSGITLSEAINELNRYSRLQIVVADSGIASLKVAGVFQTGDSEAFAKNIARIYGLKIRQSENVIELTR